MNDYGTISILEDCIEIRALGGLAIFEQIIENPQRFSNSKLTFSTLAQRVAGDGLCYITSVVNTFTGESAISDNKSTSYFTEITPDELTNLRYVFVISDGCTVRLYGAKIEYGESQMLTRQLDDKSWEFLETPNYVTELAKCQRYLLPVAYGSELRVSPNYINQNGIFYNIPIPNPMRDGNPTIICNKLRVYSNGDQTGFTFFTQNMGNCIVICAAKDNHGLTNHPLLTISDLLFSLEL